MDNQNYFKPMNFKDIMRNTFDIYRKNFLRLVVAFGILYLPIHIILSIMVTNLEPFVEELSNKVLKNSNNTEVLTKAMQKFQEQTSSSMIPLGIVILAALLAACIYLPAVFKIASEAFQGKVFSIEDAYKFSAKKFLKYMATMILLTIVVIFVSVIFAIAALIMFGILFLLLSLIGGGIAAGIGQIFQEVAALILSACIFGLFSFTTVAVVVEEKNPLDAIQTGFSLASFKFIRFVGATILGIFIVTVLSMLIAQLGIEISNASGILIIQHIISTIGSIILMPIIFVLMIVLYYDYKIRHEAIDIDQLDSELQ